MIPVDTSSDESYRLVPLVTAIRWATAALSLLLLTTSDPSREDAVIGAAMLSYALWRTLRPLDFSSRSASVAAIVAEGAGVAACVVATGYWRSPFVFGAVAVISAAGFTGGIPLAVQAAAACVAAIALPYHLLVDGASRDLTVQWAGELALVAILAGYVRRLSLHARAESTRFAGRLQQLSEVNDLLLQLRRAAQAVPISLDLEETLEWSAARLRELFQPDSVVILLREGNLWSIGRGMDAGRRLSTSELPAVIRPVADASARVRLVMFDEGATEPPLNDASLSGLYAPLSARYELIGVVAVERRRPERFELSDVAVMEDFCEHMAVAIDNARGFSRIGTLAAEQERSRIARDLHDRVGQSLALVGFELERMVKKASDERMSAGLTELREHVRSVVSELRETLYDLRTDVSAERDLAAALGEFLDRVGQRSGLSVSFDHHSSRRLTLNVEREVWRIAQEAVFNAERHARATAVKVTWTSDDEGAELCVTDDGEGLPPAHSSGRLEGYGLLGMQERAQAIGAALDLSRSPGGGTTVRLTLRR